MKVAIIMCTSRKDTEDTEAPSHTPTSTNPFTHPSTQHAHALWIGEVFGQTPDVVKMI